MATRTINLNQVADRYRRLGRQFWPTVMKGARLGAERARAEMVKRSQEAFDRGASARSWKATTSVSDRTVTVYNQAPYAGVIEYGRRPGSKPPPSKVLEPWVRRKLKVSRKKAPGVAFVVARKIGRDGIPGKYIMARARGAIIRAILAEIEDALHRALQVP